MSGEKSENSFIPLPIQDFARLSSAATGALSIFRADLDCRNQPPKFPLFTSTEISSVALGGRVLSVSDDFFAEAFHLLLVEVRYSRMQANVKD